MTDQLPPDVSGELLAIPPNRITEARGQLEAAALAGPGGLYRERAYLVALLAALYPSRLMPSDDSGAAIAGWLLVVIDLPTGQATWHIAPTDADLFGHVLRAPAEWDGHTTEQKYARIRLLTAATRQVSEQVTAERQLERARIAAGLQLLAETVITDTGPVDYVPWSAVETATRY
jgi:hypothetical protein